VHFCALHSQCLPKKVLRAAAPELTFEQINFVAGRRGAVVEDDFYNKLEKP